METNRPFLYRLWIYQSERFPVFKHGALIAVFSFSAVCLSSLLRGNIRWPDPQPTLTAFVCVFLFFLQLRIADEFKDKDKDARFRPERPVPRGLISLGELKWIAVVSALIQLVLSYLLNPPLVLVLFSVWIYMAAMTIEFGIPKWLDAHPFSYLWSHMLVMPFIDFYATACDWLPVQQTVPEGLFWFLVVSFFNGVVIEIGRKTWAPELEREGVETYSADWGITKALLSWVAALLLAFLSALLVALYIDWFWVVFVMLTAIGGYAVYVAVRFKRQPTAGGTRMLENISGLWVFLLYLILGIVPMGYFA